MQKEPIPGINLLAPWAVHPGPVSIAAIFVAECDPWEYYNGRSYKFCRVPANYEDAKQFCEAYGAHVVEINDIGESIFIKQMIL